MGRGNALKDADDLTLALLPAVLEAARAEMRHFNAGVEVSSKPDESPVTAADHEAEAILLAALARYAPQTPVIAEERAAAGELPPPEGRYFLVDALDGTRYFIRGKPEFSINVAISDAGKPVYGLIYMPPTGMLYVTRSDGGSYGGVVTSCASLPEKLDQLGLQRLATREPDRGHLMAYTSRNSAGASGDFLRQLQVHESLSMGSSEKFCLIAAGQDDVYARLGPTYEWDTAAGQAILEGAGGCVTLLDGSPLTYGKAAQGYLNPGFVAWGRTPLLTRPN